MDHLKILKRAWNIVKSYRALWVLGLILALTMGSAGSSGGSGNNGVRFRDTGSPAEWDIPMPDESREEIRQFVEGFVTQFEDGMPGWAIATIVAGLLLAIALAIVFTVLRYRAETAQIRMVNAYEEDNTELSFKEGFRLGKSKAALRMFLLDLMTGLVMFVLILVTAVPVVLPFLLWMTDNVTLGVIGTVIGASLGLLYILLLIVGSIYVNLMLHFARRLIALEDEHPIPAIQQGFKLVRKHWKPIGLMWLIMAGLSIGWAIAAMIVTFILLAIGVLIGGLIGLLIFALSNLAMSTVAAGIVGGVIGILLFLIVVTPPMLFVNGLWINYRLTVWTLTYRELTASAVLEALAPVSEDEQASEVDQEITE